MTFRYKLADWISGGALTSMMLQASASEVQARVAKDRATKEGRAREDADRFLHIVASRRDHYKAALTRIAAMGTPGMAHIGKRMAKEAREALGDTPAEQEATHA
ncbi:hypothetical protein JI664_12890 [Rhodobacter sp. NTK016B]|uniref:hypothetical protein n=1 Tax=Rhodobacter sp. NTK016B TaxID=2759676 RepID=UPI001A8F64F7|nr:hypothetical protein [Rhodobacter sp. NTK016B]MBN8292864.1 hypothetical protein [Rhodobacter sp. NTK016B]